jgi:hypothetical protein
VAAITTCLGTILQISTAQYNKAELSDENEEDAEG